MAHIDSDCFVEPDALMRAMQPINFEPDELIVVGALLTRCGERRESRKPVGRRHELATSCGALDFAGKLGTNRQRAARTFDAETQRAAINSHPASTESHHGAHDNTNREIAQSLFLTVKTVEGPGRDRGTSAVGGRWQGAAFLGG